MKTEIKENWKFPGLVQRIGTGSIKDKISKDYGINPQYWLQSIKRKTVIVTIDGNDYQNVSLGFKNIRPRSLQRFYYEQYRSIYRSYYQFHKFS